MGCDPKPQATEVCQMLPMRNALPSASELPKQTQRTPAEFTND